MTDARTVDEAYSSACNTSNLSVKAEQRNDADVLISSGMTPGLLGSALLRLHSEWDGTAKPPGRCPTPPIGTPAPGTPASNSTPDFPLAGGFSDWLKSVDLGG